MALKFKFEEIKHTIELVVIGAAKHAAQSGLFYTEEDIRSLAKDILHIHCVALDEVHGAKERELQRLMDSFDQNESVVTDLLRVASRRFRDRGKEDLS